ncbi:hypothetical protein N5U22_10670 [Aliarcobacter cryaerophilus]|uniref:hypothetical protein n=1 Tax=Aliarcobacter cryaerophilus TaxID=28198 RepID=UPI0021B6BEAD|nr:hypothetical protein [Aliarcobacter cryaerophilus]MCT7533877.1 hypothetical protein [Aliarcobacter cryaerophilus]
MEQYKKIQELIIELEKIENVNVIQSFDNVTKILKIDVNTKEYKPMFGTEVYFGNFKQRLKEIYNTPEQLFSILKKLEKNLLQDVIGTEK